MVEFFGLEDREGMTGVSVQTNTGPVECSWSGEQTTVNA